ncbi:MAG: hypothetical protein HY726_09450 [Candidatus Rokubacteria bacterium]|nr:hypothetical protein [Candidatus Rokubacteria bacterium]
MTARGWLLIGLLFLVSSACATAPTEPAKPPTVDVTGTWEGEWRALTFSYGGLVTMRLQQTGPKVTGEIRTNTPTAPGGELAGTVASNVLTFGTTTGSFFNAELTVKGGEMSGTFPWYGMQSQMVLRRK